MSYVYVGTELDLFAGAINWKTYVRRQVSTFIGRQVLEVGAGHGGTTRVLCGKAPERWVCVEPDSSLADRLIASISRGELPDCCEPKIGTLADVDDDDRFDTILYMDVLEHIADDRAEMAHAAEHLRPGGHLVVLCPAHQWLFTPFDEAVGHYRRYTKQMMRAVGPDSLTLSRLVYLDSVGLAASLGNRLVLKQSMPTVGQIGVWDRLMVPLSRVVDPILGYSMGKSVLAIWKKNN